MTYANITPEQAASLTATVIGWYMANKRPLPWRNSVDPYFIWISEIMAQQTQIATLLPYYERFIQLFPHVEALAQAESQTVLKAWEGLGYYSRAHNLHKTAGIIIEKYSGVFPQTEKELKALPGIGDYTAGAILSICFGQKAPAVDGNVLRLFARLLANEADIGIQKTKNALKAFLQTIMPEENTGAFTQGLMELGALVCTPKNPDCTHCPLASMCQARATGRVGELPVKAPKRPQKHMPVTVLLIENPLGQVLMAKRTERLLHGMWTFYQQEADWGTEEIIEHLSELGFTGEAPVPAGSARHIFTHLVWHMEAYMCRIAQTQPPKGYAFIDKQALSALAIPSAHSCFLNTLTSKE